jgi:serine/threonine-protein kinase
MVEKFLKLILYFFGFLILGSIAGLLIFKIATFEKKVIVPPLSGKSVIEAIEMLNERGLILEIEEEEYDEKTSQNHIMRQITEQGSRLEKGSGVKVVVSKGKAIFRIPYLEGMNINDVKMTLMKMGLEVAKITQVHSYTIEKNIIIAQRPLPGYSEENKVNLLVSLGLYDIAYRCPSFENLTLDEARKVAATMGLKLLEQGTGSIVVLQKPEAGSVVKRGDIITISLGRGWGLWF